MKIYSDLLTKILVEGVNRPTRTGIDAITIPHYHLEHDMSEGFPLLTTKKMAYRSIAVELEGFLKGITDKSWYKERKCNIWNEWGNPTEVEGIVDELRTRVAKGSKFDEDFIRKDVAKTVVYDLGPIYGYQWRKFGEYYGYEEWPEPCGLAYDPENLNLGIPNHALSANADQLATVLKSIKNNPNDRRMVVSAWNPNQLHMMALPPCHILWKVNVLGDKLHLCWFQRSCDVPLGIPFNIASYAMLQLLLCKYSGLKPGKLSGFLDDVHIYANQIEGVREQLKREPRPLPTLDIAHNEPFSFNDKDELQVNWTHGDLALFDYNPHPKIEFPIAV